MDIVRHGQAVSESHGPRAAGGGKPTGTAVYRLGSRIEVRIKVRRMEKKKVA